MVLESVPDIWAPWAKKAKETNLEPRKVAFLQEYGPYAKRYGAMTGIAPEILLAIGASESNWGAAGSIFGIKGPSPSGKSNNYKTWEMINGQRVDMTDEFATYDSPDEAFQHFTALLQQPLYREASKYVKETGDSAGFLRMINDAGYATDRNWANSIVSIANSMGDGNYPDAPPPGPGKSMYDRATEAVRGSGPGIGISESDPQGLAKLVIKRRVDAEQARQAVTDEEARAKLEISLNRPLPDVASERVGTSIKPPGTGDEGLKDKGIWSRSVDIIGDQADAPVAGLGEQAGTGARKAILKTTAESLGGNGLAGSLNLPSAAEIAGGAIKGAYKYTEGIGDVKLPFGVSGAPTPGGGGRSPSSLTVGDVQSADIPGAKALRDKVGEVEGAHLLQKSGIAKELGVEGKLPSAGDVLSGFVPTTVGGAAANAIGAKSLDEAILGVQVLSKGGGIAHIPGTARNLAAEVAKNAPERASLEMIQAVAADSNRGGIARAPLGRTPAESRYGAVVKAAALQHMGPEAAAKAEMGIIKTGITWADWGDSVTAFDPNAATWLPKAVPDAKQAPGAVDPGSASVRPSTGNLEADIRQSVADVRAEKAGTDARGQMQKARPAIGGENSMLGRDGAPKGPWKPRQLSEAEQADIDRLAFGGAPDGEAERAGMKLVEDTQPRPTPVGDALERDRGLFEGMSSTQLKEQYQRFVDGAQSLPDAPLRARAADLRDLAGDILRKRGEQITSETSIEAYVRRVEGMDAKQLRQESNRVRNAVGKYPPGPLKSKAMDELDAFENVMERKSSGNYAPTPERPATTWNVTNKAGETRTVETEAGPVSSSTEEARARLARNTAEQDALNAGMAADRGVARARQAQEGIAKLRRPQIGGEGSVVAGAGRPNVAKTDEEWAGRVAKAVEMAQGGAEHRFWYENSSKEILNMAKGDIDDADRIARIAALGSNKQKVAAQGQYILQSFNALKEGRATRASPMLQVSARVDPLIKMPNDEFDQWVIGQIRKGDNQKTTNFWLDMMDDIDPVRAARVREASGATATVDAWMLRAFGFAEDGAYKSPTAAQYRVIADGIDQVAKTMGWSSKQAQAAIWVQAIVEGGASRAEAATNYADSVLAHATRLQQEVMPNPGSPRWETVGPALENASPQAVAEHAMRIDQAFRDEQGYDVLGRVLHIPVDPVHGNPLAGAANSAGFVDEMQSKAIDAYALARAEALGQSDVTWIRPFNYKSEGLHNAMDINLSRAVSPDELAALRNELPDLIVIPSDKGVTVMRAPDEADYLARQEGISKHMDVNAANKEAQKRVSAAVDSLFDEAAFDGKIDTFAADGRRLDVGSPDSLYTDILNRPDVRSAVSEVQQRIAAADDGLVAAAARGPTNQASGAGPDGASAAGRLTEGAPGRPSAGQLPAGNGLHAPGGVSGQAVAGPVRPEGLQPGRAPATGLKGVKDFQFADPFHPTPEELQEFSELGGAELIAEANRLDQAGVTGYRARDAITDAVTLAKKLGDPGSELRRKLQEEGLMPAVTGNDKENGPPQNRQLVMKDLVEGAAKSQQTRLNDALEIVNAKQKKGIGSRVASEVAGVLGLPRTFALSADTGLARDMTLMASHPGGMGAAATGARANLQGYFSDDFAKQADAWVENHPLHDFLTNKQNFPNGGWRTGPLHVYEHGGGVASDLRVPEMSGLNESAVSKFAEKNVPLLSQGIERSDRALAVGRNVAGMDWVARRYASLAQEFGVESPRFLSEMRSTVDWANHLRGYSGSALAKNLGVLNALTSPQQMVSRLQLALDPVVFAARGDYASARYAAENLLGFAAEQMSLLVAMKLAAQSQKHGLWSVNLNPTETDFGQVKVGNQRFDFMAGMGPIIKLLSRAGAAGSDMAFGTDYAPNDQAPVEDLLMRWFENKENPSSKILTDRILHHKNPDLETLRNSFVPSLATGMLDARKNGSSLGLLGLVGGAGFLGVGTNSYKDANDLKREITDKAYPGKSYNDLGDVDRLKVLAQLPDDAPRNAKTQERQKYDAMLAQKGYIGEAPQGETKSEAKKRAAANSDILDNLGPDEQVQRWFWEGGSLSSKDAVDKALKLEVPDKKYGGLKEVKLEGTSRNLATDEGKKFWETHGKAVADHFSDAPIKANKDLLEYYASRTDSKLPFAKQPLEVQNRIKGQIRSDVREDDSYVDAILAYAGSGGTDKQYRVHSEAAAEYLNKLRDKYGKDPAQEGYKFMKPDPSKKTGYVPIDVEPPKRASAATGQRTIKLPSGRTIAVAA